jgi:uncharacterized membrane protein YkgB
MSRVINAILGIGVAIIVYLFFILALNIVFDEPEYPNECYEGLNKPYQENLTQAEQQTFFEEQQSQREECEAPYQEAREKYGYSMFLGAVVIGILLVLAIIPLTSMANIAAGIGAAGVALIVYGFAIGWNQTGEYLKLFLLLIAGAIIIGIAVWAQKKDKPKNKKRK